MVSRENATNFKIAELLLAHQADLVQKSLASTLALELAQADEIAKAVNVLDEISKLQAEGAVSLEQSAEVVALCNHIKLNHLFKDDLSARYTSEQLYRSAKGEANTSSDSVNQVPERTNPTDP